MKQHPFSLFAGTAFIALSLLGAGCEPPKPATPSGPDVTASLELATGDSLELSHTVLGIGGKLARTLTEAWKGTRTVRLDSFESGKAAAIAWDTTIERETEASKKARATFQVNKAKGAASSTTVLPEPVMERVSTNGTITGINLATAHAVTSPPFWKEGAMNLVGDSSAIWLSSDAFMELSKANKTTLNLGFLDSSAARILSNMKEVKSIIALLKKETTKIEDRQDPTLLTRDGDLVTVPLLVNGKEVHVQAIKAHNLFGSITVLNNPANPLVLELSFNPLLAGAAELASKDQAIAGLFGYQVTSITRTTAQ